MNSIETTAPLQTESISFEFDLQHSPEKVWRALTDPTLLAEWLLPVVGFTLEPGAAFTFRTQPHPGFPCSGILTVLPSPRLPLPSATYAASCGRIAL